MVPQNHSPSGSKNKKSGSAIFDPSQKYRAKTLGSGTRADELNEVGIIIKASQPQANKFESKNFEDFLISVSERLHHCDTNEEEIFKHSNATNNGHIHSPDLLGLDSSSIYLDPMDAQEDTEIDPEVIHILRNIVDESNDVEKFETKSRMVNQTLEQPDLRRFDVEPALNPKKKTKCSTLPSLPPLPSLFNTTERPICSVVPSDNRSDVPIYQTRNQDFNSMEEMIVTKSRTGNAPITIHKVKQARNDKKRTLPGPTSKDVVFGRGGLANQHVGNKRMLIKVTGMKPQYQKANKKKKTDMSIDIVNSVLESGGRFLIRGDDGTWTLAPMAKARMKVSQAFRQETPLERLGRVLDQMSKDEEASNGAKIFPEKEKEKLAKKLEEHIACLDK